MHKLIRNKVLGRGKGDPPPDAFDSFFISEIELQSSFGLASFGEIMTRIENGTLDKGIFAYCHMQLVFSGNISKMLFPNKNAISRIRNRAKRIKEKLNITSLPRIESVSGRNYIEHFNERMDRYLGKVQGIIIKRDISTEKPKTIEVDGKSLKANYLQHFNASNKTLTLFDEEIIIDDINSELSYVNNLAKNWLKSKHGS